MADTFIDSIRRRRADLLFIISVAAIYFFSYFQRVAIPGTIFDQLQKDMSLSSVVVASLGAIYLYVYGGLQIFCGMSIDRYGSLKAIIFGGAMLSLGSILFPLSRSVLTLYATRALVGLGSSLAYLCIIKEVDTRFSGRNFSMVLSATLLIGYTGGLFGTFPFERLMDTYGWRNALLGIGAASSAALVCVIYLGLRTPIPATRSMGTSPIPALKDVLANKLSRPVISGNALLFGVYFLIQSVIGKKLLEDCYGLSSSTAAGYTFCMMLAAMGCTVLSGFVTRLMHNRRNPLLRIATSAIALTAAVMVVNLTYARNSTVAFVCYVALGASMGGSPMFTCSMRELNRSDSAATSVGVLNAAAYLTIAVLSSLAGLVLDHYTGQAVVTASALRYPPAAYRTVFIGLFVLAFFAFVSGLLVKETRGCNLWTGE